VQNRERLRIVANTLAAHQIGSSRTVAMHRVLIPHHRGASLALFNSDFSGKLPSASELLGMAQRMLIPQQSRLQRSCFAVVRIQHYNLCKTGE
jgi:hypothetical protein